MLLAMIVLIIPTVFNSTVGGTESEKVEQLSHIAAIVLLLLYGLFLYFQFKSHVISLLLGSHHHEAPEMTKKDAIILLVVATIQYLGWLKY